MSATFSLRFAPWRRLVIAAIVVSALAAPVCLAETAFRRVFVPADAPQSWPTGGERYLPVDSVEFQKLVDETNGESLSSSVRLRNAMFRAELGDGGTLAGSVSYDIELIGDKPQILPLEPLSLSVTSASWQGGSGTPVQSGLWSRASEETEWGVLVPRSGTLRLDWQASASVASQQIREFALDLPPAVPQTLEILLPVEYQAVMPSAELMRTQAESDTKQRWLFQLAGRGPHRLRLLRQSTLSTAPRSLPRVSQVAAYRIEPAGLDLATSFRVEPHDVFVELQCAVANDLQIKSIAIDRQPARWQFEENQPGRSLIIDLPAAARPQEIEIEAIAPVTLDRPWRLPAIRATGAEWTEGTSLVVVSPRLELKSFSADAATLEHIVGLQPAAAATEAYRVQEWSPEAAVEVVVGRPQPRLSVEFATAIDLGAGEATARIAARIRSELRPTYRVAAEVAEGWSIESVKTDPAAALREWHLVDDGARAHLELQLNEPIQPGAPLRVEFDARKSRDGAMPGTVAELLVLDFTSATTRRNLALLRSRPQRQMELLSGPMTARILPGELTPHERALLPDPLVGELLDLTGIALSQEVALRPRPAHYEAEVQAELVMRPQALTQGYEIECRSVSGEVSELLVRFDRPLPATAEWLLLGDDSSVEGRRLEPTLQDDGTESSATYLVRLPFEVTDLVRLAVSYSTPMEESARYNAISFPQAERWTGHVDVRGPLHSVAMEDAGWIPVGWSMRSDESGDAASLVSSYRLDSDQSSRAAPLAIRRIDTKTDAASLAAWLAEYESHQAADGAAICSAVYFLESAGAPELELKLPSHTELQAAWLNGQQLEPRDLEAAERTYRVRLADAGRYPTIALQYVANGPALGRTTTIAPNLPETSFPVRLSRWTLWTPEQFVPDDLVTGYSARRVPWRERLFGPLARSVGQEVFLPWRAEAWPQLWSAPVEGLKTRLLAERIANRLDERLSSAEPQTWGQLLTDVNAQLAGEDVISLDAVALQTTGILPSSPATMAVAQASIHPGQQLASHALALLFSPNRILLTTSDRVAHWRGQLQPTSAPRVFAVTAEELAQEIEAKSTQAGSGIIAIQPWTSATSQSAVNWSGLLPPGISDVGQRACTIEFIDGTPTVVVRRAYAQQAYWYVAWLAAVVGGTWWLGRRTERFVLAVSVAAAACFIMPASWLAFPQAVLVGLVSALVLRLVFANTVPADNERSTQSFVPRTATLAVFLGAILGASEAHGAPAVAALHQVFVPIDAGGNRQGSDVYLSQSHLDALQNAQGSGNRGNARYVITNVAIRGILPDEPTATVEPWTITVAIESFVPTTELEVSVRQSDGEWLENSSSFDGKPALLTWPPSGEGCRVEVKGVGAHELKLAVRPRVSASQSRAQLQLHLPKLPGLQLELATPEGVEDIHVAGAGRIVRDSRGLWRTNLANSDALKVDWATASKRAQNFAGDVEQLLWLRVEPAIAYLSMQLRFQELAAPRRTLDLEVPSELKLLSPAIDSPVERIETLEAGVSRLHMKPGWEAGGRVPLEFQSQRTSSLGRFYFPNVQLRGHVAERRLFAVSVGEGLSYQEQSGDAPRSISASEFAAAWGATDRPPLIAYSAPRNSADWSLRVWPDASTFTAEQSLALHCKSEGARVEYRAAVDRIAGRLLVHQLRVPPDMTIDEVTLTDDSGRTAAPMRWSRPREGLVTVFLGRPLGQSHVLGVTGRLAATPDGALAAPRIVLAGAESDELRTTVWRDPQVLVNWVDPETAPRELARPLAAPSSSEVLVGRYAWDIAEAIGEQRLQLRANNQRFTADTVVSIDETPRGRTLKLHARISVLAGVLGQVQVAVPKGVTEPFEIQPAGVGAVGRVEDVAGRRRVTLVFNEPLGAERSVELRFSGRLAAPTDGRVEVPLLEVLGAAEGRRFVMLPTRLADRPIEWQIAGLRREPLPDGLRHLGSQSPGALPYRVVGSQFTAREPIYQGPLRSALLRHAWVEGVLDAEGKLSATASFLLQPGRATHCSLRLPAGGRLLQIVADDQPASRQQLSDRTWRVALGPPFLPRVIKVSYIANLANPGARVRLAPPEVLIGGAALPLPTTNWQISLVDGQRIGAATMGRKVAAPKYAEGRHQALARALEDAAAVALESPEAEVRPWFATWRSQLEVAAGSVRRWGAEPARVEFEPAIDAEPTSWTQLAQKMAGREFTLSSTASEYPPTLPQRPATSLHNRATYLTSDAAGQIEFIRAPLAAGGIWRWGAAAAILALGLTLERHLQSRPEWIDALRRWPHALAIGAGLVWWGLFSPSVLGLVMMLLAAAALAVESARKRAAARPRNVSTQLTARMS